MIKKYLGLDWGEKRIGLSIADSENRVALPLKTINNFQELLEVVKEEGIDFLVIGQPKKMSGDEANQPLFLKFLDLLRKNNFSFFLIDERLSSVQADSLRVKEFKFDRDALSAMIILQSYLDKTYD
ncbi:MAG TPA: Holliday junction resolvase RuvX [Patescibacteria group bacterium]|jgi:putative Holliday junction resolvase|nr:Holliday junction resolvase RuvX [Patescibacteria group bacterium]